MFPRITAVLRSLLIIVLKCLWETNIEWKKVITVRQKTLFLVLPYLGALSLQTRTKLRKPPKGILNCYKLKIVFKEKKKKKPFRFKDNIPKELRSGGVY